MAISAREANIRRDQELNKGVGLYFYEPVAPRRCCVCREGIYRGTVIDPDDAKYTTICDSCKSDQIRKAEKSLDWFLVETLRDALDNLNTWDADTDWEEE